MGRLRRAGVGRRRRRTATALLLTAIAVAVPCGAWFFAGNRAVERRARFEEKAVATTAYKRGVKQAERLATRLEVLREAESRRPFYHYQNLYHDPRAAAEGAWVSISPLAQGPVDALIEAHFQVDDAGLLTLPTLNDEFPDLGLHSNQGGQCHLFDQLKDITFFCTLESAAATMTYRPRDAIAGYGGGELSSNRRPVLVEVLEAEAWRQHLRANAIYADIKYGRKRDRRLNGARDTLRGDVSLAPLRGDGKVEVEIGSLVWYTLPVGGEPGLVALRGLETPAGVWSQGFVISQETVAQYLESSSGPAVFRPARRSRAAPPPGEVRFEVAGTPWEVVLDISHSLRQTSSRELADRSRFLRLFLLGTAAAALAGLMVVTMLYQSERLAQQRARFAASAAHELRTPLAGLRLYGEMLAEGLGDRSRVREYARRMAGEADRLGRVVTNVLGFTRLERDAFSVSPRPGDLAVAVAGVIERLAPALEAGGVGVELELASDLPAVSFDRDALAHILQNLLDNAEKYTRDAGERGIRVVLRRHEPEARDRYVAPKVRQRYVELAVADSGKGIPRELRRKLFRPFARGHHPDAPAGLGLGLTLVKELARAQGGDVTYHDSPTGGAVFTVTLPVV